MVFPRQRPRRPEPAANSLLQSRLFRMTPVVLRMLPAGLATACGLSFEPGAYLASSSSSQPVVLLLGGYSDLSPNGSTAVFQVSGSPSGELSEVSGGLALPGAAAWAVAKQGEAVWAILEGPERTLTRNALGPGQQDGWVQDALPPNPTRRPGFAFSGQQFFATGGLDNNESVSAEVRSLSLEPGVVPAAWQVSAATLASARADSAVVSHNGRLWVVGGVGGASNPWVASAAVESVALAPGDQPEGSFTLAPDLGNGTVGPAVIGSGEFLIAIGGGRIPHSDASGLEPLSNEPLDRMTFARVTPDPPYLGPWVDGAPLPTPLEGPSAFIVGKRLFVAGGYRGMGAPRSASFFSIAVAGDGEPVGAWREESVRLPEGRSRLLALPL